MIKSPSFSRSRSSTTTRNSPLLNASRASSIEASLIGPTEGFGITREGAGVRGGREEVDPLAERGLLGDMVRGDEEGELHFLSLTNRE